MDSEAQENNVALRAYCVFCGKKFTATISIPNGWSHVYGEEWWEEGQVLCDDHALIADFRDSQCPGCVASWGDDCPLFRSFAYQHHRDITQKDYLLLENGFCPRRVNGTFMVDTNKREYEDLDLSKRAPSESGTMLAQAIKEYIKEFP